MVAKPSESADQPEVAALRKKIRGEPLTEEERRLLESTYRKPSQPGPSITQEQMTAILAERARRGE
jgi:hypothetical protein